MVTSYHLRRDPHHFSESLVTHRDYFFWPIVSLKLLKQKLRESRGFSSVLTPPSTYGWLTAEAEYACGG